MWTSIQDFYFISGANNATFQHFCEDAFTRHNAHANRACNLTAVCCVALFANLCDFVDGVANAELCANGQGVELNALGGEVFCKLACAKSVNAVLFHFGNGLNAQKTDLAMPIACVSITNNAVVFSYFNKGDSVFCFPFFSLTFTATIFIFPSRIFRFCHRPFR